MIEEKKVGRIVRLSFCFRWLGLQLYHVVRNDLIFQPKVPDPSLLEFTVTGKEIKHVITSNKSKDRREMGSLFFHYFL